MKIKPSRYNFFFKVKRRNYLAFNAMTGGMLDVPKKDYQKIKTILALSDTRQLSKDGGGELFASLFEGRFFVEERTDELKVLRVRNMVSRFNTDSLALAVMVTSECNFKCVFCNRHDSSIKMGRKEAQNLLRYLSQAIPGKKRLHINWFGGEPLLCFQLIMDLSESIKGICRKHHCTFTASMTTNGYLLSEKVSREFPKLNFNCVQIMISGTSMQHDQDTPLYDGSGAFEQILNNLQSSSENCTYLLRINVDQIREDEMALILDRLESLKLNENIHITFGSSDPASPVCSMSPCVFYRMKFSSNKGPFLKKGNVYLQAISRGFRYFEDPKPRPYGFCQAMIYKNLVVDPSCRVYLCPFDVDDSTKAVGLIDSEGKIKITNQPDIINWLSWDPTDDPSCKNCNVLPVCMGGCKIVRKMRPKKNKYCPTIKPYLQELLEAQSLKSNKSHNGSNTHFLYTNVVNCKSVVNSVVKGGII